MEHRRAWAVARWIVAALGLHAYACDSSRWSGRCCCVSMVLSASRGCELERCRLRHVVIW